MYERVRKWEGGEIWMVLDNRVEMFNGVRSHMSFIVVCSC